MGEKSKGFTLIELLAVIVILAIIALIATPIVLNLIEGARKGVFARSAEVVLKASKLYYSSSLVEDIIPNKITFTCNNKECFSDNGVKLDVDGNMGEGIIGITSDGKISLELGNGTYCAEKEEDDTRITVTKKKCQFKEKILNKKYTIGEAVFLGGYNWHVIADLNNQVTLLMDSSQLPNMTHCTDENNSDNNCTFNGTYYVYSWDKSLIRKYLNGEFLINLENKIKNSIVPTAICVEPSKNTTENLEKSYGGYLVSEVNDLGKICMNQVSDKVRLISALEYYNISPYYNLNNILNGSDYSSWLYCKSDLCGNANGWWWTMSSSSAESDSIVRGAQFVYGGGNLGNYRGSFAYGLRPVITIVK